jgi:hypothetical protein
MDRVLLFRGSSLCLYGLGSVDLECVDIGIAPTCFCRSLIWTFCGNVGHFTFACDRFVGIKL